MLGIERHSYTTSRANENPRLQPILLESNLENHDQTDSNNRTIGLPFDFKHVAGTCDMSVMITQIENSKTSHVDTNIFQQQPTNEPTTPQAENYDRKQKIAKSDIAAPTNFKHLEHVGFEFGM
jgi:hypothetical protein